METRIISWNVNGIRAAIRKDFFVSFQSLNPTVLCLQESKAQDDQIVEALQQELEKLGYYFYSNSAEKKGYSGTISITKQKPISIQRDIGVEEFDHEGRVLTLEYEKYYVVNVYVPNSGDKLARLDYRSQWDQAFLKYLKKLEEHKPIFVCGDFNVAHTDIDLARPKSNYNKSPGYTQVEINGFTGFTDSQLVDSFRFFYPNKTESYSWWSYRAMARERNIGWRIDYVLTSLSITPTLKDAFICPEILGSDHCPVGIIC